MGHELQERYSALVDAKLRATIVQKDGIVWNNSYEGNAKAGAVKIPVRDTEVTVGDYDKKSGAKKTHGDTAYLTVTIDKDKAVNEIIDGYDAEAVPDGLVADRLDSAGYALAMQINTDATAELEDSATEMESTEPMTKTTVYETFVDARTALSKEKVPTAGRFALVSPETYALLLKCDQFVRATSLGDDVVQDGRVGAIAGFAVYEDVTLSATTEFIAGHPNWCTRVREWAVPVHMQALDQSGDYIGACAIQGRSVYAHKVTKPQTLLIKRNTPADDGDAPADDGNP